jgi:hypothetical protein
MGCVRKREGRGGEAAERVGEREGGRNEPITFALHDVYNCIWDQRLKQDEIATSKLGELLTPPLNRPTPLISPESGVLIIINRQ